MDDAFFADDTTDYTEAAVAIIESSGITMDRKIQILERLCELKSDFGMYRVRRYLSLDGYAYLVKKVIQEERANQNA